MPISIISHISILEVRSTTSYSKVKGIVVATNTRLNEVGFRWHRLSTRLNARVPLHMIPKKWVALEDIPLHITKKLDSLSEGQQVVGELTKEGFSF